MMALTNTKTILRYLLLLLSVIFTAGFGALERFNCCAPIKFKTATTTTSTTIIPAITSYYCYDQSSRHCDDGSSHREPFAIMRTHSRTSKSAQYVSCTSKTSLHSLSSLSSSSDPTTSLDVDAVLKYALAILTEIGLFLGFFMTVDRLIASFQITKVPFIVNCLLFYGIALKSRLLNPLANNRPSPKTLETATTTINNNIQQEQSTNKKKKRIMPTWTPPGVVFPIVWLLIIGPIRAISSAMVYKVTHQYAHAAIMALMVHLAVGNVWNTINNVERRYGVAVVGVFFVLVTKALAAYQYYHVVPLAGKLLGATLIWLSIASALVTATWRLNPDPQTGKPEPLYPIRGVTQTKFIWLSIKK